MSKETTKVYDKAREIRSAERSKLLIGAIDNINNLHFNITCRNNTINELNIKIELCTISEGDRRLCGRQINYAALNSGNEDTSIPQ